MSAPGTRRPSLRLIGERPPLDLPLTGQPLEPTGAGARNQAAPGAPILRLAAAATEPTAMLTAILREARRAILLTYGPCGAASPGLVTAWARRLAETRPMAFGERRLLLAELAELAGDVHA